MVKKKKKKGRKEILFYLSHGFCEYGDNVLAITGLHIDACIFYNL